MGLHWSGVELGEYFDLTFLYDAALSLHSSECRCSLPTQHLLWPPHLHDGRHRLPCEGHVRRLRVSHQESLGRESRATAKRGTKEEEDTGRWIDEELLQRDASTNQACSLQRVHRRSGAPYPSPEAPPYHSSKHLFRQYQQHRGRSCMVGCHMWCVVRA